MAKKTKEDLPTMTPADAALQCRREPSQINHALAAGKLTKKVIHNSRGGTMVVIDDTFRAYMAKCHEKDAQKN